MPDQCYRCQIGADMAYTFYRLQQTKHNQAPFIASISVCGDCLGALPAIVAHLNDLAAARTH